MPIYFFFLLAGPFLLKSSVGSWNRPLKGASNWANDWRGRFETWNAFTIIPEWGASDGRAGGCHPPPLEPLVKLSERSVLAVKRAFSSGGGFMSQSHLVMQGLWINCGVWELILKFKKTNQPAVQ